MRLEWKKEELIHNTGKHWWTCGLCRGGSSSYRTVSHTESCPFSDETVEVIFVSVGPEHDAEICGRCNAEHFDCPVMTVTDGWDMVTHERLLSLCNRYAEGYKDRQAVRSRLREALRERKFEGQKLEDLCGGDHEKMRQAVVEIETPASGSKILWTLSEKALVCTSCDFSRGPELTCAYLDVTGRTDKPCQRGSK